MRRKIKGFTLVELLIVIAILAILLTILSPALETAREQATGAVCMANQRTLAFAWTLYAEDNKGHLVGADNNPDKNWYCWAICPLDKYNNPIQGYVDGVSPATMEEKQRGIMAGRLWNYVKDLNAYHCRGDRRKFDGNKMTFRTYSISTAMNSPYAPGYGHETFKRIGSISTPEEFYVFVEEADQRGWNINSWAVYPMGSPDQNYWVDELAIWHNNAGTLGFADGHAECRKWIDERTIEIMESEYKWDKLYQPNNPDLQYMQQHYGARWTGN
jgi:prepilin-type N-terminal cleavage/methylation domain-containing protein/prepilin-type processing-associated H-X9-DG protein